MLRTLNWLVCGLLLMGAVSVHAQALPVFNFGFEDVSLADGVSSFSAPGWGPLSGAGTINPTAAMISGGLAPEGANVGFLNGNPSLMSQGFGSPIPFGTYVLQVDVGQRLDVPIASLGLNLRSNTTLLLSSFFSNPTPAPGTFVTWTRTFDILPTNVNGSFAGGNLNVLLLATGGSGTQVLIDNFRLTFFPIPEPTHLVAAAIGVLGLLRLSRSRLSRK